MRLIDYFLYIILLLSITKCVQDPISGFSGWTDPPIGPPPSPQGPYINSLIKIQGNLFVGTSKGIYKTTDEGQNWVLMNNGVPTFNIKVEDATNEGFVYALHTDQTNPNSYNHYLYVSTNFGNSWTKEVYIDESKYNLESGSINAKDNNNVYVTGTLIKESEGFGKQGIIRTTDGGSSWQIVYHKDYINCCPSTFPVVFNSSGIVYAFGSPFMRSTDNGLTWEIISNINFVEIINAEFTADDKIYILVYEYSDPEYPERNLYVSMDLGYSWLLLKKQINSFSLTSSSDIFISEYYSGISKSTDSGNSWEHLYDVSGEILIDRNNEIYVWSSDGDIKKSKDYGKYWYNINSPFRN